MAGHLLRAPTAKGLSCTRTLLAAFEDTQLRPEVLHIVGVSEAELSIDFDALAGGLAPGARVVLVGPDLAGESDTQLLGPELRNGLSVYIFRQTYQRYMVQCHEAEAPNFVALFHPGLDIHYFSWYPCLRHWTMNRIPVLVTAYSMPDGIGEKPSTVKALLETLVGTGGGAGMWVIEEDNPANADDGCFNAAYFVVLGSQGELPVLPEELYFALFRGLQAVGHPFAPRVGYLDVGEEAMVSASSPRLLAAIAEGAMRGATVGEDGCDDATARDFAVTVLDQALGQGAGDVWRKAGVQRPRCENCGDGFDSERWHRSICPAVGKTPLRTGDQVRLAFLQRKEYNGREGTLQEFNKAKERWVVRMGEKDALFRAVNLEKMTDQCG